MLSNENTIFVIIDIQDKLVKASNNGLQVVNSSSKVAKAAQILNIPTIITEQYPKGLGHTVETIKGIIPNITPIEKTAFSALEEIEFKEQVKKLNRKQILLCGIETHICVLQTALDLILNGYEVFILKDGVTSRNEYENNVGIDLLKQCGAKITCTEIVLFEWLRSSKHVHFKEIQALIK